MRKQLMIEAWVLKNAQENPEHSGEALFLGCPNALLVQPLVQIRDGLGGLFTNAKDPENRIPKGLLPKATDAKSIDLLIQHTRSIDALLQAGVAITVFYVELPKMVSDLYLRQREARYPHLRLVPILPEMESTYRNTLPIAVYKSKNPSDREPTYSAIDYHHPSFVSNEASHAFYVHLQALEHRKPSHKL